MGMQRKCNCSACDPCDVSWYCPAAMSRPVTRYEISQMFQIYAELPPYRRTDPNVEWQMSFETLQMMLKEPVAQSDALTAIEVKGQPLPNFTFLGIPIHVVGIKGSSIQLAIKAR